MWTLPKKIKYFIDSFVAFSHFPVRLASSLGALFSLLGLVYAGFIIYQRLALQIDAPGWSSLMVVVLIAAGAQLLILGVLGEYLWRSLDETRRRPRFIIERVIEHADSGQRVGASHWLARLPPSVPPSSRGEGANPPRVPRQVGGKVLQEDSPLETTHCRPAWLQDSRSSKRIRPLRSTAAPAPPVVQCLRAPYQRGGELTQTDS